jgi:hypothetical protein
LKKSEREQGCFSLKIAGPNPNFTWDAIDFSA